MKRLPLLLFGLLAAPAAHAEDAIEFNRDIRPILSENCYACHGPDKAHRKAKLRLDERDSAITRKTIVPGKPAESELVARIFSADKDEVMPPPASRKKLTAAQKELLKRWIAAGAEYQAHWAYLPPVRPALPKVRQETWVRDPIDRFILARLEARKIRPSPEADRRTLLRRLSLDLVGLPPTPEEVEAFVRDTEPRAYERQVDRLLASPHYGERMAVPWLDVVRFSDTVGYHGDQNQNIFPYRDYVIDACNTNKPFDQFTIEQLAGDLLPKPTPAQLVATGFHRLNMMTREGGAQPKEYLAKYAADRVRTVAMAWLGSTMGCCECHDHKYDPFTMKDFYSFSAFFADVKQWGVYQDYDYTPNPDLKGWSNDHPFPPEIEVKSAYLERRLQQLRERLRQACAAATDEAGFVAWSKTSRTFLSRFPDGWQTPPAVPGKGGQLQRDGSILLTGPAKQGSEERIVLQPGPGPLAMVRLEVLPHAQHKGLVTRSGADSAFLQLAAFVRRDNTERRVAFFHADADHQDPRYANGHALLGVTAGWKTSGRHKTSRQTSVWMLDEPDELAEGDELVVSIKSANVGCVRLSVSPFACVDLRQSPELSQQTYVLSQGASPEIRAILREIYECRAGRAMSMITESMAPPPTRVLPRGNWLDESGEVVLPSVPSFLPQPANPSGQRLTRLDLARWLVAPENPLTARVFVNRLWKQLFGTGLSGVLEDVGAQGEWPTHPELLDWLALDFREHGWDVKRLVKQIVLSATYRQDARLRPELRDVDPGNRLLASQSPRRLEAEFVRDQALAVAGLLCRDVGGPSALPYQPAGYYVNLQFPDRDYVPHTDERQYRRGVYMHWQRTFLHPMLANFDAPSREECTANRIVANTPQQALTLLNDPTFVEAARVLAQRLPAAADAERLDQLYRRALARPAKAAEVEALTAFLETQRNLYRASPDDARKLLRIGLTPPAGDAVELAAWTQVCRVVLNLHEIITRY